MKYCKNVYTFLTILHLGLCHMITIFGKGFFSFIYLFIFFWKIKKNFGIPSSLDNAKIGNAKHYNHHNNLSMRRILKKRISAHFTLFDISSNLAVPQYIGTPHRHVVLVAVRCGIVCVVQDTGIMVHGLMYLTQGRRMTTVYIWGILNRGRTLAKTIDKNISGIKHISLHHNSIQCLSTCKYKCTVSI